MAESGERPLLSLVIPFHNEEECVESVLEEAFAALSAEGAPPFEVVAADDGSTDGTPALLRAFQEREPRLRVLRLEPNGGQSAAFAAGFRAARGRYIATMDGDGQNDPADILPVFDLLRREGADAACGIRARRADSFLRRASSRIAFRVRNAVLRDGVVDTGCSLKVFRRGALLRIPHFRNAHRFYPALVRMGGGRIAQMPVAHRPRSAGTSKYGRGINSRLWVGLADLAGVWWLSRRAIRSASRESGPGRP